MSALSPEQLKFIAGLGALLVLTGMLLALLRAAVAGHVSGTHQRLVNTLPGINCGQCGYPSCEAYAQALESGAAELIKCRPGGPDTATELAAGLGRRAVLCSSYDEELFRPREVAYIHPSLCNGCRRCALHCPVDAIEGEPKKTHHVLSEFCLGCDQCVSQCREQAIELIKVPLTTSSFDWNLEAVRHNLRRGVT